MRLTKFFQEESGQGMTEYILLVFLIAILAYLAVEIFGKRIRGSFISAGNKVQGITDSKPGIQN